MRTTIVGSVIAIAVAVVAGYAFFRAPVVQAPGPTATSTGPAATTTPEQDASTTPEMPAPHRGPTIETTPFTVYLGAATQYGTSSAELMGQEVAQAVVGYEWESIYPGGMFDSAELPQWDTENPGTKYQVYVWSEQANDYIHLGDYPAGVEVQFPRNQLVGPTKFKILGISPTLRVCPGDRSFNWNVRFTFNAALNIVRTPVTQDLFFFQTCKMR